MWYPSSVVLGIVMDSRAEKRMPPCTSRRTWFRRECIELQKTIYVGNLPWSVTNEDLQKAVSQYAEVLTARIATDRETGRSRGFGFVEVPADKAEAVIEALNGSTWEDRQLTVNEARPREERPRRY